MRKTLIAAACCLLLVTGAHAQDAVITVPSLTAALAAPPAPAEQPLPRQEAEIGLQLSRIVYKEPDLMREDGFMVGVVGSYARNTSAVRLKFDGTFSVGSVDYTGSYSDGTPVTYSGIPDTMFEVRATLGPTAFASAASAYLPYVGLGYRYLVDGADVMPGGYLRESNYTYIPIGIEARPTTTGPWRFEITLEYDHFLGGTQYSQLSDVDPGFSDMTNKQTSGMGYRASLRFVKAGRHSLIIEPFYKYWKIDQSETADITYLGMPWGYGWEPKNNSTEFGLRIQGRF